MRTIAVIEDNADNLLLVTAILEEEFRVDAYGAGPDALAGIRQRHPDLVLMDISLPGMDGEEVLKHLRADPATVSLPVVALTAHAMAGDRERFLAAGFDGYLSKPIVDEAEMLGLIRDLLERRG